MRKLNFALFVILVTYFSISVESVHLSNDFKERQWQQFKVNFNRHYATPEEEIFRKYIFLGNLQAIEDHNEAYRRGLTTFKMGVNEFSDWTQAELARLHNLRTG